MRTLLLTGLIATLLLAAGCPRDLTSTKYNSEVRTASYPWDVGGAQSEQAAREQAQLDAEAAAAPQGDDSAVELPVGERWPALSESDTLDERLLRGVWLRVAFMRTERINLLIPERIDRLTIRETGNFTISYSASNPEGTPPPIDGSWSKEGPGLLSLTPQGGQTFVVNAEIYRDDFLFIWNAATKESFWYARVPQSYSPQIASKRFETSLGTFEIGSVVQSNFNFTVTGPTVRSGSGYYEDGILRLRWEDVQSNTGGYGVLIPGPDWTSMKGAWWVDDYEAAPYGGVWDMLLEGSSV